MKSFVIKSKHGNFEILVDDEDFERIAKYFWSINKKNDGYFSVESRLVDKSVKRQRSSPGTRKPKKKCVRLHRYVLDVTDENIEIDHIDRNPLNNQKSNLRIATRNQNMRNTRFKTRMNKTGFIGVYKRGNVFKACLSINDKTVHVPGSFTTAESAAKARDRLVLKHSGEFAILNFPKPKEG